MNMEIYKYGLSLYTDMALRFQKSPLSTIVCSDRRKFIQNFYKDTLYIMNHRTGLQGAY